MKDFVFVTKTVRTHIPAHTSINKFYESCKKINVFNSPPETPQRQSPAENKKKSKKKHKKKSPPTDKVEAKVTASVIVSQASPIGDENIGNKMLRSMGWTGGGLGARGNGIEEPIEAFIRKRRLGLG